MQRTTESSSGLVSFIRKILRDYSPSRKEVKIELVATVERYYEQETKVPVPALAHTTAVPAVSAYSTTDLFLELKVSGNIPKPSEYYSPLALNLSRPEVQEIYDMLRQGKNARFKGDLIIETGGQHFQHQ